MSHGGGVLAAVKHNIHATAISRPDHLEAISLCLHLHIPLSVCCVYIPPNPGSIHISSLVSYLSDLAAIPCSDIIVIGDFNLPDIDWDTLSAVSHSSEQFCDFVSTLTSLNWLTSLPMSKQYLRPHCYQHQSSHSGNKKLPQPLSIITFKVTHSVPLSHKLHRNMCLIFPKQTTVASVHI